MNRTVAILIAATGSAAMLLATFTANADYAVQDRGTWPESWPEELEPFRSKALTLVGPKIPSRHYAIPFTDREEFEAAWPHLLSLKTPGSSLILKSGPSFWLEGDAAAGVCVHAPPAEVARSGDAERENAIKRKSRWATETYIELIVDGEIVDLNRIALPPDTPIVDQRFEDEAD